MGSTARTGFAALAAVVFLLPSIGGASFAYADETASSTDATTTDSGDATATETGDGDSTMTEDDSGSTTPDSFLENTSLTSDTDDASSTANSTDNTASSTDEETSGLGSDEEYLNLPLSYDENTNSYYFSDITPYCISGVDENGHQQTTDIRWYIGTYPDATFYPYEGTLRDCAGAADAYGRHGAVDLVDDYRYGLDTYDGDRSIVIDNGTRKYILRYSAEAGIVSAPDSPSYDYTAPFRPIRDSSAEHNVLPSSINGSIFSVDQSVCDLFLSSIGGLGSSTNPQNAFDLDRNIWAATIPPQDVTQYGVDPTATSSDGWVLAENRINLQYPMVTSRDSGSGNPACDGINDSFSMDHLDLNQLFYRPSDGTAYLFLWASTKFQPEGGWNNGKFLDPLHSNLTPLGYVKLSLSDGIWSIGTSTEATTTSACTDHCASSVLFLPGTESSRLYYRDDLDFEHQVWEPDLYTDIPYLALNNDGTSKYPIYTKDVVDEVYGNNPIEHEAARLAGENLMVYGDFERFMDSLVTDGTIKEWRSYPYDWRYDVFDIIKNGTPTEEPDGTIQTTYLTSVLEEMASTSPTGKVTVIGHSNGGLLAKALAVSLGENASRFIDHIILVGSPQWGTPEAIGALLHADNFSSFPEIIVNQTTARQVENNMGDPYDLLPSSEYFVHVADPVVTFDPDGFSGLLSAQFGQELNTFSSLTNFITDSAGLDIEVGNTNDLRTPAVAAPDLVSKATESHEKLDTWAPPSDISVTAVSGWGQLTTSGLKYSTASEASCNGFFDRTCVDTPILRHSPIVTRDGDGTVVSPSSLGNTGDTWYLNLEKLNGGAIIHQNLTSAEPIQNLINALLEDKPISDPYLSKEKPLGDQNSLTVVSSHSPVNITAMNASGNKTGVVSIPGTDFPGVTEQVPGSSVKIAGNEEYLYLPQSDYDVSITGLDTGSASFEIGTLNPDGSLETVKIFKDIPVTASTTGSLTIPEDISGTSILTIDENGDENSITLNLNAGTALYTPPDSETGASSSGRTQASRSDPELPAESKTLINDSEVLAVATSSVAVLSTTSLKIPSRISEQIPAPQAINIPSIPEENFSHQAASVYVGFTSISALFKTLYNWIRDAWKIISYFFDLL